MTTKKVCLQKQIRDIAFSMQIPRGKYKRRSGFVVAPAKAIGAEVVLLDELLAIVDSFLEPSPQTREMQKLLENRPKLESIDAECSRTLAVYEHWFQIFKPKLEAFFADHVSREKLGKLIEDLEKDVSFYHKRELVCRKARSFAKMYEYIGVQKEIEEVLERLVALEKKGEHKR